MRKIMAGLGLIALVGVGTYVYVSETGFVTLSKEDIVKAVEKNAELTNYERKVSMSISFTDKSLLDESLQTIDDTLLIIDETRNKDNYSIDYEFSSKESEFVGNQTLVDNQLTIKSPMYHRYILFDDYSEKAMKSTVVSSEQLIDFINATYDSKKINKDFVENEDKVKKILIENENDAVKGLLNSFIGNVEDGFIYDSILLNNARITNKLLKEHKSESEIQIAQQEKIQSLQTQLMNVFKNTTINSSKVEVKITDKKLIKSWSATLQLTYVNPATQEKIPFTFYMDLSKSNIGKSEVQSIQTDVTNAIPYNRMTDDIDYFENENLSIEKNAEEDTKVTQEGYKESVGTLEDVGEFETIVKDKDTESEKTNK